MLTRCFILSTLILTSITAEARHHSDIDITISVAPPPAQVIVSPPRGYTQCYVTRGMWVNQVWIPPHQECTNPQASGSAIWVSGHWGCVKPGRHGHCGKWKWLSHRWMRNAPSAEMHEHGRRINPREGRPHDHDHAHERNDVQVPAHELETRHEHRSHGHSREVT